MAAKPKPKKPATRAEKGLALRRKVLGAAYVDKARSGLDDFRRDFDQMMNEFVWHDVWGRPGLPLKTRSLLNMALLTTLNRPEELRLHFHGALRNGCTLAEIREVLLHTGVYAGIPAIVAAIRALREEVEKLPKMAKKKVAKKRR
jgi:4-carboxymuconolactone decarboxylase